MILLKQFEFGLGSMMILKSRERILKSGFNGRVRESSWQHNAAHSNFCSEIIETISILMTILLTSLAAQTHFIKYVRLAAMEEAITTR